jgi:hypothetical protein
MAIVIFGAGYAVADYRWREKFNKAMKYQSGSAEYERLKTLWSHRNAAKRMGVDIDSQKWDRIVQEEENNYEKTYKRDYGHPPPINPRSDPY